MVLLRKPVISRIVEWFLPSAVEVLSEPQYLRKHAVYSPEMAMLLIEKNSFGCWNGCRNTSIL